MHRGGSFVRREWQRVALLLVWYMTWLFMGFLSATCTAVRKVLSNVCFIKCNVLKFTFTIYSTSKLCCKNSKRCRHRNFWLSYHCSQPTLNRGSGVFIEEQPFYGSERGRRVQAEGWGPGALCDSTPPRFRAARRLSGQNMQGLSTGLYKLLGYWRLVPRR